MEWLLGKFSSFSFHRYNECCNFHIECQHSKQLNGVHCGLYASVLMCVILCELWLEYNYLCFVPSFLDAVVVLMNHEDNLFFIRDILWQSMHTDKKLWFLCKNIDFHRKSFGSRNFGNSFGVFCMNRNYAYRKFFLWPFLWISLYALWYAENDTNLLGGMLPQILAKHPKSQLFFAVHICSHERHLESRNNQNNCCT